MNLFFPFRLVAAVTSAVLLAALYWTGELPVRTTTLLAAVFLAAAYCQFFGGSEAIAALGLAVQTLLAIYLLVRLRLGS